METKTIVIIAIILSTLTNLLWISGLILADINLFILSLIIVIISLIPAIKYFNQISEFFRKRNGEVVDDERTQYIENKSNVLSFAFVIAVSIYSAVGIFTLRDTLNTELAYPFIIIVVMGLIVNIIAKAYYKRKYSD